MTATFAKTITEADIILFAGASGDNNAIHINDEFARTTPFGGRIAHAIGMPAVIGILMLLGIVAKNAILLVDFAIEEIRRGTPREPALIEAGLKRAQPS